MCGQDIEKSKEVTISELARELTEISEKKYNGHAFTFNYMIDEFAKKLLEKYTINLKIKDRLNESI